jgi:hypothetical protein
MEMSGKERKRFDPRIACSLRVLAAALIFLVAFPLLQGGAAGGAIWEDNGAPVCVDPAAQESPVICSDGAGGAFILWEDKRFDAMTKSDLYAQHFSSTGEKMWEYDVEVSRSLEDQEYQCITADGEGGFYAAWKDCRVDTAGDIYAVRIDSDGGVHAGWTDGGTVVSEDALNYTHGHPCICAVPTGGAVIAFEWYRGATGTDVYAQRMSAGGAALWPANGMAVSGFNLNQQDPVIAWCEGGVLPGPMVAWRDGNPSGGSNDDIYAKKLKISDGTAASAAWNPDGNPVKDDSAGDDHQQQDQRIVADGSGGAIVTWETYISASGSYVGAQRLNEEGSAQWAGDLVCDAAGDQLDPAITTDGAGGAIIAWDDQRTDGGDIYVQRVDSGGTLHWGPAPRAVNGQAASTFPNTQGDPAVVEDGSGGAFIAWEDDRGGAANLFMQWMSHLGLPEYDTDGVPLAAAPNEQKTISACAGDAGQALFCWTDTRTDPDQDVYAQSVSTTDTDTWYLAEGCTGGDFETWVLVQNPGATDVTCDLTFMTSAGEIAGPQDYPVPAGTRHSFNLNAYVTDWDVSTRVEATGDVVCERAMYGGNRTWAHDSIGYAP